MDFDKLARHDVQLNRLVTGLLNANVYPTFEEAYREIRAILLDAEQITSKKQLDAVQKAIDAAVYEPTRKAWDKVQSELEDLAVYENEYQSEYYAAIAATAGASAVVLASPEDKVRSYVNRAVMALASGDNVTTGTFNEFIGRHIDKEMTGIKNQIILGYINGIPTNDVIENINRILTGTIKRDAEGLARTGLSAYANAATELMAQDNKEVIEYRVFSATLDSRTTIGCAALDRKKWKMGDKSYPTLPRHYRCRSRYVFLVYGQDGKFDGDRPAKGDEITQVAANTNYEQFLKRQSPEFVRDVLGVKRAQLFLSGELRLSQFIDMVGNPLTLNELKARDLID